ncbi:MAG: hypothetical protein ACLFWM_08900 [Actinomycetota bacterium]
MPRARKPALDDLTSTQYGEEARLVRQKRATPNLTGEQQEGPSRPFVSPDEVPNLSDPSSRPGEPLTTGMDIGPGAGSEVMSPTGDPVRRTLQAILANNPDNNGVMRLLDLLNAMGR